MSVVGQKPVRHACWPGWEPHVLTDDDYGDSDIGDLLRMAMPPGSVVMRDVGLQPGAIWKCDTCGTTWVAGPPAYANVFTPSWRREHWWERRRRAQHQEEVT